MSRQGDKLLSDVTPTSGATALSHFVRGLNAAAVFLAGDLPVAKCPAASLRSDWEAVGNDIRRATNKYVAKHVPKEHA